MQDGQEGRTETVAMKVTPSEDRAIRFVADAQGVSRSELLRTMAVDEIVTEYAKMREKLGIPTETAA